MTIKDLFAPRAWRLFWWHTLDNAHITSYFSPTNFIIPT